MIQQQLINKNNCMRNILSLALFVLISTNIVIAQNDNVKQNTCRRIGFSEIRSEQFKKIFKYFQVDGFFELPTHFDRNYKGSVRPYSYKHTSGESPFYVNINKGDKTRNDKETVISYLYNETNGNYILGAITAVARGLTAVKWWLVTFDFSGNVIDYIPIREYIGDVRTIESQINSDFTANIQRLDFPDNDCIIKKDNGQPLDNLKGQRIDTKYEITTDGKFKKINEVRYQPQLYPPSMLLNEKVNIRDRGEKRM